MKTILIATAIVAFWAGTALAFSLSFGLPNSVDTSMLRGRAAVDDTVTGSVPGKKRLPAKPQHSSSDPSDCLGRADR
ncbi:hypothetical protein [Sinorhizobium sp. BG8]|uniref:hypothetical protein n=1 Tax=Sinorhizobium sp. BG8 TaxID=2613773 RepID=UPI00193D19DA|nr:hypothetical protein [Sinorhizobium sp. BG8]QRM54148.1 hypothetical protein F3Y30_05975 [Sinorhizobium sp. BG8]